LIGYHSFPVELMRNSCSRIGKLLCEKGKLSNCACPCDYFLVPVAKRTSGNTPQGYSSVPQSSKIKQNSLCNCELKILVSVFMIWLMKTFIFVN